MNEKEVMVKEDDKPPIISMRKRRKLSIKSHDIIWTLHQNHLVSIRVKMWTFPTLQLSDEVVGGFF
jgi:hypothetical protein